MDWLNENWHWLAPWFGVAYLCYYFDKLIKVVDRLRERVNILEAKTRDMRIVDEEWD